MMKRGYKVVKPGLHKSLVRRAAVSTCVLTRQFAVQDRVEGQPRNTMYALVLGPWGQAIWVNYVHQ